MLRLGRRGLLSLCIAFSWKGIGSRAVLSQPFGHDQVQYQILHSRPFDYDQVQFQILHSRPFDYDQVPPTPLLLGKLVQHRMTV